LKARFLAQFRTALVWQFAGLLLGGALLFGLARWFPVLDYITRAQHAISRLEVWGGVLYPLLNALCNVLLLPGGVLAIGSGLFFGLWWGTALNIAGNVLGAAIAFGLGRLVGRRWLVARLLAQPRWAALDRSIERHGWKIIFLTQLHPLFPTSLLNYLYGVTRIRFGTCLLWIALGQAPGLFLYAYLGTLTQHGIRVLKGRAHPMPYEYVLWLGGLVVAVVVTTLLGRIALRLLAESKAETAALAGEGVIDASVVADPSAGKA